MVSKKITIGYITYNLGRWRMTIDNCESMLECPECGCRVTWLDYSRAIGAHGTHFCPYCGADLREAKDEQTN